MVFTLGCQLFRFRRSPRSDLKRGKFLHPWLPTTPHSSLRLDHLLLPPSCHCRSWPRRIWRIVILCNFEDFRRGTANVGFFVVFHFKISCLDFCFDFDFWVFLAYSSRNPFPLHVLVSNSRSSTVCLRFGFLTLLSSNTKVLLDALFVA